MRGFSPRGRRGARRQSDGDPLLVPVDDGDDHDPIEWIGLDPATLQPFPGPDPEEAIPGLTDIDVLVGLPFDLPGPASGPWGGDVPTIVQRAGLPENLLGLREPRGALESLRRFGAGYDSVYGAEMLGGLEDRVGRYEFAYGRNIEDRVPPAVGYSFNPPASPEEQQVAFMMVVVGTPDGFRFHTWHHPYVCSWLRALREGGLDALLTKDNQQLDDASSFDFDALYHPQLVATPYPKESIDWHHTGIQSVYNWEVFFFGPMLVAERLQDARRFEDALRWYRYVLDPTDRTDRDDWTTPWQFTWFAEVADYTVHELLMQWYVDPALLDPQALQDLEDQVRDWQLHPFDPHRIARLRPSAYRRWAAMRYVDCLLDWADSLFTEDTMESISQATMLYARAWQILGPRPSVLPEQQPVVDKSWNEIALGDLDALSNFLVELENYLPEFSVVTDSGTPVAPLLGLYFCIPENPVLLAFWDRVEDRLYKIRHCMNIDGIVRKLALFEPPLDPGALVGGGFAAGLLTGATGTDAEAAQAALPVRRFEPMLQLALDLCSDVRSLGSALLAATEKSDGEKLAALRATHERELLSAVRDVKLAQIEEATLQLAALQAGLAAAGERKAYYGAILNRSPRETRQLALLQQAHSLRTVSQATQLAGQVLGLIPNFDIGIAGFAASPVVKVSWGGSNLAQAIGAASSAFALAASVKEQTASRVGLLAGWDRRWEDWKLQERVAKHDVEQGTRQVRAAEVRLEIARQDLKAHDLQREHARGIETFLREKFSNAELYDWMVEQLQRLHTDAWRLALDLARQAERAFRFELEGDDAVAAAAFVQAGHWDASHRGLLAGEKLHHDLRRMEAAWIQRSRRRLEMTRHVSLAEVAPLAVLELRQTGSCQFALPESLFDRDYPGHYARRISSVAITIPMESGPVPRVNARLTLLADKTRTDRAATGPYTESPIGSDPRFRYRAASGRSVVTSHGRQDTGTFGDGGADPRFGPFEGSGVLSTWSLEMPADTATFDVRDLPDVLLHIRYTALDGGQSLRAAAAADAAAASIVTARLFSLRQDFPDAWQQFMAPPESATDQSLTFALKAGDFPAWAHSALQISGLGVFFVVGDDVSADPAWTGGRTMQVALTGPDSHGVVAGGDPDWPVQAPGPDFWDGSSARAVLFPTTAQPNAANVLPGQPELQLTIDPTVAYPLAEGGLGSWTLTVPAAGIGDVPELQVSPPPTYVRLDPDKLLDIALVVAFAG